MHQYYESGSEEEGQHGANSDLSSRRHHHKQNQSQQSASSRGANRESLEEGEAAAEEDGDTRDSLDIKPPQAIRTDRKRKKADRHHHREHQDRNHHSHPHTHHNQHPRHHHKEERSSSRGGIKEDRHYPQNYPPHHHQQQVHPREGIKGSRYEEEIRRVGGYENNSREIHYPSSRSSSKSGREHSKRSPQLHSEGSGRQHRDGELVVAEHGDQLLEDLRSRLLSKRNQMEGDGRKSSGRRKEEVGEEVMLGENYREHQHRSSSKKQQQRHVEGRKEERQSSKNKREKQQIVEMIDSPEAHYYSEEREGEKERQREKVGKRKPQLSPVQTVEDRELIARRAKLLEADREKSQRMEMARLEREKKRRGRPGNDQGEEMQRDRSESPEVERKRSKKMEEAKRDKSSKRVEEEIVSLSDRTSSEEDEDGQDSRNGSDEDDESGSASASESDDEEDSKSDEEDSKSDSESSEGESKSDIDVPCSPLSIGDLAKSDVSRHSRSLSRSRSSKSHSRSPQRRRSSPVRGRYSDEDEDRHHEPISTDEEGEDVEAGQDNKDVEMVEPVDEEALKKQKEEEEKKAFEASLPNYYPALQGCRSVEEFLCLNRIEEGTYGVVYRAKDKRTDQVVALKRLKMEKEKEGFPITSLREINTLLKGQHPNIVTVREIVVGSNMDRIFIVMDYVEHDLKGLMETMRHKKQTFLPAEVKCLLHQLLRAVAHLHDNWILHRDLKTSNLLLSHKGILKVGDFGLAREYGSPLKAYTSVVVTLWYRAPELLLCSKEYSTPIDVWSVGCIFAEFLMMTALFPGKSELDQLNRIFKDLGTPNEKIWPGYSELPAVQKMTFTEYPVSRLRQKFSTVTSEFGLGLLQGLLTYDPQKRLTADNALKSNYFKELPLPIDPAMFPSWPAKSELGARKALASSPKPPSGGSQFKQLAGDDPMGFHLGVNGPGGIMDGHSRALAMGPGFSLKF